MEITSTAVSSQPTHNQELRLSADLLRASFRSDDFPQDWSDEQRVASLTRYLKWLRLKRTYPMARLAPTRDIDLFWHLHMLAPVAYYKDCMSLFGKVLDHDGGFGKGKNELPELERIFKLTAALWEQEYHEPYGEDCVWIRDAGLTNCWHDCQNRCWHACQDGS